MHDLTTNTNHECESMGLIERYKKNLKKYHTFMYLHVGVVVNVNNFLHAFI